MKKALTRTLKIMIDSGSLSAFDVEEIEQWENEGGNPGATRDFLNSLAPVKRGEIFEVKGGDFHFENGKLYFEAEIEILALH
jgi:hypothetical protein